MRGDGATDGEGGFDGPSRCQPHELPLHAHAGVCITHPHKYLIPHVQVVSAVKRVAGKLIHLTSDSLGRRRNIHHPLTDALGLFLINYSCH